MLPAKLAFQPTAKTLFQQGRVLYQHGSVRSDAHETRQAAAVVAVQGGNNQYAAFQQLLQVFYDLKGFVIAVIPEHLV